MVVRYFGRAVLVRDVAVVAGWLHAAMRAQRLVAPGLIIGDAIIDTAERR